MSGHNAYDREKVEHERRDMKITKEYPKGTRKKIPVYVRKIGEEITEIEIPDEIDNTGKQFRVLSGVVELDQPEPKPLKVLKGLDGVIDDVLGNRVPLSAIRGQVMCECLRLANEKFSSFTMDEIGSAARTLYDACMKTQGEV